MIRAAVVGYGNIGKSVIEALQNSNDFEIAGIIRRDVKNSVIPDEIKDYKITSDISELGKVDVAILCNPSRNIPEIAEKYLSLGINTADSYDIHSSIYELKKKLDPIAKKSGAVSVISAGWDPGSDSVIRTMFEAMAPRGKTYTNFGPGMSMGHTVAVKSIEGVKEALSVTIPKGTGIHRRMVYIELMDGYNFEKVADAIKKDAYFIKDETYVEQVEDITKVIDMGHGVNLVRKGVSGVTYNQNFEFNMKINNPALTGQVLVAAARASMLQKPGCYTMIEIPVIDFIEGDREKIIKSLV